MLSPALAAALLLAAQPLTGAAHAAACQGGDAGGGALVSFARDITSASELALGEARTPRSAPQPWRYGAAMTSVGVPVEDGTLVEGSWSVGGKQPDFLVDYRDESLRRSVVEPARAIGAGPGSTWEKIRALQELVRSVVPNDGHRDPGYIAHNASLLAKLDRVASLGEYVDLRAGVCRENALLTTIALREAGFDARFGYFKVLERKRFAPDEAFGDHAVALLEVDGVTYVIDTFEPFGKLLNGSSPGGPGPASAALRRLRRSEPARGRKCRLPRALPPLAERLPGNPPRAVSHRILSMPRRRTPVRSESATLS